MKSGLIIELKSSKPEPILLGGHPIVKSYQLGGLLTAKRFGKRIGDFLPDIDPTSKTEAKILAKWQDWFTFKRVPWAVTRPKLNQYKLWKIWET